MRLLTLSLLFLGINSVSKADELVDLKLVQDSYDQLEREQASSVNVDQINFKSLLPGTKKLQVICPAIEDVEDVWQGLPGSGLNSVGNWAISGAQSYISQPISEVKSVAMAALGKEWIVTCRYRKVLGAVNSDLYVYLPAGAFRKITDTFIIIQLSPHIDLGIEFTL